MLASRSRQKPKMTQVVVAKEVSGVLHISKPESKEDNHIQPLNIFLH